MDAALQMILEAQQRTNDIMTGICFMLGLIGGLLLMKILWDKV